MAPAALQCSRAGAHRAPRLLPRRGGLLAPVARPPPGGRPPTRPYASSSPSSSSHPATGAAPTPGKTPPADADADAEPPAPAPAPDEDGGDEPPRGAMSRRLAAATEDALLTGGRAGRRAVADAGFSDELKARLLAKVQDARFRSEHAGAFAEAGLAGGASARARAAAPPGPAWTGEESTEAAVRRMLQDAHKPLRPGAGGGGGKPRLPDLQPIDLRLAPAPRASPGERAATAREKAGAYADERTTGTGTAAATGGRSAEERAAFRREVQERFGPAGRTMPATLTGLASLANERIEDAMARGQFRGIARGAGVGRDARADNPFVDTTEYILNKMIQRQDLAPPWIEKQQELRRATRVFRARLRADWRRHAARMIAAGGGPLAHQLRRARRLARAEALLHPPAPGTTTTTTTTPPPADDDAAAGGLAEAERRVLSEWATEEEQESDPRPAPTESRSRAPADATIAGSPAPSASSAKEEDVAKEEEEEKEEEEDEEDEAVALPRPFRDADWVAAERAYMEAAVRHLNALTRSYNLMAPELAKKPYFSLERELARCYADVAPTVAAAIRDRAAAPPARRPSLAGDRARPGLLDRFGGGERDGAAKVYDSRAPHYGFREMWRDLFGGGKTG